MSEKSVRANEAVRRLVEGEPVTLPLVAAASGRSPRGILMQARTEGWHVVVVSDDSAGGDDGIGRMLKEAMRVISTIRLPEDPAALKGEKERIELVTALTRAAEKIEDLIERHNNNNNNNNNDKDDGDDEDIADVFRRIDRRIEELAGEYARKLVAERHDGGEGQARWERVVQRSAD